MQQDQAIVLLYNALSHCEGIPELLNVGIDVCEIQNKMESGNIITDSYSKELKLLIAACMEQEAWARDEWAYLEEVNEESICS